MAITMIVAKGKSIVDTLAALDPHGCKVFFARKLRNGDIALTLDTGVKHCKCKRGYGNDLGTNGTCTNCGW